jgi:hypothetical protein
MRFTQAVHQALPGACRDGLQALENRDRGRVSCNDPRKLAGSVCLDVALKRADPNGQRWDYGIGIKQESGDDKVIWVEVHPASSSNVREVVAKLEWLKRWLARSAPALQEITAKRDGFVWVSSGKVDIPMGTPQTKRLAAAGIKLPQRHLRIE